MAIKQKLEIQMESRWLFFKLQRYENVTCHVSLNYTNNAEEVHKIRKMINTELNSKKP